MTSAATSRRERRDDERTADNERRPRRFGIGSNKVPQVFGDEDRERQLGEHAPSHRDLLGSLIRNASGCHSNRQHLPNVNVVALRWL